MRNIFFALCALFFIAPSSSQAEPVSNTGLFLDVPDLNLEITKSPFNFTATGDTENYSAGVAIRSGSLLFGFESRRNNPFQDRDGPDAGLDNPAGLSTQSSVLYDSMHRIVLGVVVDDFSLFGFNGISTQRVRRSVTYSDTSKVRITYYRGNGEALPDHKCSEETCTRYVTSFGESYSQDTDIGIAIGAGFEQRLAGGSLRFEYAMTYYPETSQQLAYNRTSTSNDVPNLGTNVETVSWDEVFEHSVNLRWKAKF